MFCGRCGNRLPGQGNFCNRCGAPLAPGQPAGPPPSGPPPAARRGRSKAPWIVVGLALVGAGAGGTYLALRGAPGGAKKSGAGPAVGKPDTENLPPRVTRLSAGAQRVEIGGSTSLTATIIDPENDPYHAWWSASCGIVAPRADAPGQALFLAPSAPGSCAITVEVQDHELRRARRVQYTIVVAGGGA